jgi:hypothetical protein
VAGICQIVFIVFVELLRQAEAVGNEFVPSVEADGGELAA